MTVEETSVIGTNVFENIPGHGTVVGVATPQELDMVKQAGIRVDAIALLHDDPGVVQKYTKARNDHIQAWITMLNRMGVSYAWPISIDWETGYVYINNK